MGYILDECPQVQACCWCIQLRHGTAVVALLGLAWAATFVYWFSEPGRDRAHAWFLIPELYTAGHYFNGASSVLLAAAHVLLMFAAAYESDALCEVYIWFMACYWVALAAYGAIVAVTAALNEQLYIAVVFALFIVIVLLISFYFVLVVANYRMTLP